MSDHSELDCCGSDVDETERLLLEDTLSLTEKEKSQPPADIDEIVPPVKSIEASLMPSPSSDTLFGKQRKCQTGSYGREKKSQPSA